MTAEVHAGRMSGRATRLGNVWSREHRLLAVAVVLVAIATTWVILAPSSGERVQSSIPAWVWVVAFLLAEMCAVRIHFRRDSHTFSLSEIPLVAGLFLLSPQALALTRCAGTVAALAAGRRQGPVKLAYNGALVTLSSLVAAAVFRATSALAGFDSPVSWPLALLAALAAETVSMGVIHITLLLAQGTFPWHTLPKAFAFGVVAILVNGSVGLLVALTAPAQPLAILLVAAPALTMLGLYRAYTRERSNHQRADLLYSVTLDLQGRGSNADVVQTVLHRVRLLLGADVTEVVLAAGGDEEAVVLRDCSESAPAAERGAAGWLDSWTGPGGSTVVPWPSADAASGRTRGQAVVAVVGDDGGVRCAMLVAHSGDQVRRFDGRDARLVESLASHIRSALDGIRMSRRLEQQAFQDSLTGLANRAQLTRRTSEALRWLEGGDLASVALLFVDLDDFKLANDSAGHVAGDHLLREAGRRISVVAGPDNLVARLGGDEFAVLCMARGMHRASSLADAIILALHPPAQVAGREMSVRGSVGIAHAQPGEGVETLLRHADIAMYRAKERGKRRVELFEASLETAVIEQLALRDDLERAVERREFEVAYQPIVDLGSGRPTGVEALVRWRHPQRGLLAPAAFIELAEQTGLVEPMGEIVLELACRDLVSWRSRIPSAVRCTVSVNVAPRQLRDPAFADRVLDIVAASGLAASDLVLEVTETALLENHEVAVDNLARLRTAGASVALDDFGTGYSSLGYLRSLPVDVVKIDRTFISGLADSASDRSMTLAIVRLLNTLDVVTVAEGIETQAQLDCVRAIGCDRGQGFIYSMPKPAEEMGLMLAAPDWLEPPRSRAG